MTADAKFWDDAAEKYSRKPMPDPTSYERKLALIKARLSPSDDVLEVGCGTGTLALDLAPRARHIHAVDISREMVRIGRDKAASANVTNVTFHCQTVDERLPFDAESFACVCAFNILHLAQNREQVLAELFELLQPGGLLVSSTPCLRETWVPYRPVLTLMRWVGKAPHVVSLSKVELARELEAAGFVDLKSPEVGAKKMVAFVVARRPDGG